MGEFPGIRVTEYEELGQGNREEEKEQEDECGCHKPP